MKERSALIFEAPRGGGWITAIVGDPVHVAMEKADDAAVFQIDRRNDCETLEHSELLGQRALGR